MNNAINGQFNDIIFKLVVFYGLSMVVVCDVMKLLLNKY